MRKRLLCFLLLSCAIQFCVAQKFGEKLTQINALIKNGDYFRAANLCNSILKSSSSLDDKDADVLRSKLDWITHFKSLENQVFLIIRKENYEEPIVVLRKIEQDGVFSVKNKELVALLVKAAKYKNTSIEGRYISAAEGYIKVGNIERALTILRLFPDNPTAILKIKGIEAIESNLTPCDEKTYISLKNEMDRFYQSCELQKAKNIAKDILQLDCYKNDRRTLSRLRQINDEQSQLREIASLNSGNKAGDSHNREYIIPIYNRLLKTHRSCVEWDYFYFVYYTAERVKSSDPCNKTAIKWYLDAKQISKTWAAKERIDEKILVIENCIKCDDKIALFEQLSSRAKQFYNQCQYEEAKALYAEAEKISVGCTSDKVNRIKENWVKIGQDIDLNNSIVQRFNRLKTEADSLMELKQCIEAYKFYKEADTLRTKCNKLVKSDLVAKILKAKCCNFNQLFDNLVDSSKRAHNLLLYKDGSRLADSALYLANRKAQNCIPFPKIKSLEAYICETYGRNCPPLPPSPPPPVADVTPYKGFEIVVGAFYNNPTLTSNNRLTLPSWGWGGYNVGVNYILGTDGFGEIKFGAMFSKNHFQIDQPYTNIENFDFELLKIGLEASFRLRKRTPSFPFLNFGMAINTPLKFEYNMGNKAVNDRNYLSTGVGLKVGLGFVIKSRISLSLSYDLVANLLDTKAANPPIFLTKSVYKTVGFNVAYRFIKRNKAKPISINKQ